ncbi:molybdopterin-guanine dinucleotide biosynthesis protein A [Aureimonas sp. SA4125]|nr:molybdopterin-guanine dinucleotide biosynthesis protein A [Aureimonas sp. SA4125]
MVERRPSSSPWATHAYRVAAIVPEAAGTADGHLLGEEDGVALLYAGSADVEFHRVETGNYRDNLASGEAMLWVTLSIEDTGVRLLSVTADPAEGEAMTEAGNLMVDVAPMPAEIAQRLADFIKTHHVERVFKKRKRE